jgi:hypothetical protein
MKLPIDVTNNLKRLGLGVALAGVVFGGAAGTASAVEGEMHAPIAGGCGGSVYWNTAGDPIATASVNNPDACVVYVKRLLRSDIEPIDLSETLKPVTDLFHAGTDTP